jgi:hypothetical protein
MTLYDVDHSYAFLLFGDLGIYALVNEKETLLFNLRSA